jgi:thiamine biosynthesis lipoprotein ApbE
MFETYLEDVDEAVEQIRNNRYSSAIEHLGGNVYVTVDNNDKTDCCVDIRYPSDVPQILMSLLS